MPHCVDLFGTLELSEHLVPETVQHFPFFSNGVLKSLSVRLLSICKVVLPLSGHGSQNRHRNSGRLSPLSCFYFIPDTTPHFSSYQLVERDSFPKFFVIVTFKIVLSHLVAFFFSPAYHIFQFLLYSFHGVFRWF